MDWLKLAFYLLAALAVAFLAFVLIDSREGGGNALVFAYGNQLPSATFSSRSGGFEGVQPAVLVGWRLEFESNRNSEFGVANIVQVEGGRVPGAVYELSPAQAETLREEMEGRGFYGSIGVSAKLPNGTEVPAIAYVLSGETHAAPPSRPTVEAASEGLAEFGYGEPERQELADAAAGAGS